MFDDIIYSVMDWPLNMLLILLICKFIIIYSLMLFPLLLVLIFTDVNDEYM